MTLQSSGLRPSTPARLWAKTIALSLSAVVAGGAVMSPMCAWQGRLMLGRSPAFTPITWDPRYAPMDLPVWLVGLAWVALWTLHMRSAASRRSGFVHAGLPLAVLAWTIWQSAKFAYACNTF
jgi:hypothetical protein